MTEKNLDDIYKARFWVSVYVCAMLSAANVWWVGHHLRAGASRQPDSCQSRFVEAQHESEWLRQRLNTMRAEMKIESDQADEAAFRLQRCLNREKDTIERIQQAQAELKEWTQQLEPVCSWDNRGGE